MIWFFLFIFGAIFGSFLNVVALRYGGNRFLFSPHVIGGRSHCPHCGRTLRWFELFPIVSFIAQGGKCRRCKARIGFQYPLVELISGCIFLFAPLRLMALAGSPQILTSIFWIAILEALLLVAYIDIRLGIIPDELNIFLFVVGIFMAISLQETSGIWLDRALGALFGVAFFGFLVLITRGRGMGMGDVKLALPLGFLFGWEDMILLCGVAFVAGAAVGIITIIARRKTMKGTLPFGPFLALAAGITFFFGSEIVAFYLRLIGA